MNVSLDLFVKVVRLPEPEDRFVAYLTIVLNEDPDFARQFLSRLFGEKFDQIALSKASVAFATQQYSKPDLKADLVAQSEASEERLGAEIKLFSPLGRGQLQKYLRHGFTWIVLISGRPINVPAAVLADPHYLKPADEKHFFWSDFYADVKAAAEKPTSTILNQGLLALFDAFGLNPASKFGDPAQAAIKVGQKLTIKVARGKVIKFEVTKVHRQQIAGKLIGRDGQKTDTTIVRLKGVPIPQLGGFEIIDVEEPKKAS